MRGEERDEERGREARGELKRELRCISELPLPKVEYLGRCHITENWAQ